MIVSPRTASSPRPSNTCQEPLPQGMVSTPSPREVAALFAEQTPASPRQGKRKVAQSNYNGLAGLRSPSPDYLAYKLQSRVQSQQLIRAFQEPCSPKASQDEPCFRPGPHPERATWLEVAAPKSKADPRIPTTVECPCCHKQVLVSSCAEHLKRCQHKANEARARPAPPLADPHSDGGLVVVRARLSWAEVPSPSQRDSGPHTRLCRVCKRQVLVSSCKIHEKRCQHLTSRSASPPRSPRPCNPYRRCLWTDQAPPSLSMGPPTAFCSICERQVMVSSFQQHQEKCRQITAQRQEASPRRSASPLSPHRRASWSDIASPRISPAMPSGTTPTATASRVSGRQPRLSGGGSSGGRRCSSGGRRSAVAAEPRSCGGGQQPGDLSGSSCAEGEVLRGPSLVLPGLSRSLSFKLLRDAEVVTAA
eukprot:TRINITY_DN107752_c0_g1_i1.p1 TRINITY_DN107752_c0_g1~~TRINITY_DN107752_c0_g1_i1.p1  ORF type:complete len:428 (+),score=48.35 TRINITY_DN107752_c0_g1_i1:26-1285(+)